MGKGEVLGRKGENIFILCFFFYIDYQDLSMLILLVVFEPSDFGF